MRSCPSCGEDGPDGARFCASCGIALAVGPAPQELRKVVTLVFCDLSGSTSLGERLDPESVRQMVTRYFDAMREALERHGGTVEKFIGDAVMAVFGIPEVHEDDALRAVRAAVEMRTALAELNEQLERRYGVQLRVRTGVNTGEVIAGDASQGHGFATGDAVNVAARFEQAAGAGEILIGEHTFELVRDAVQVEPVTPLDLKGKSEPVAAFRLIEVVDPAERRGAPLVGREHELALLRAAFERTTAAGTCELVNVLGPAGMGKSRLTSEFADGVREQATVVAGRCLSYGDGLTFWPLREVVDQLAGSDDRDTSEESQAKFERLLPVDEDTPLIVERVAGALGRTDADAHPSEIFWAVRKLLEAAAGERPLVVVFEDVHWAEPTFLDLVEYLAENITEVPVLLVAVARADLLDARPDFATGATRLELQPLTPGETHALVEHLAGDADLPERVFTAGGGNPLFVEELVRVVVDAPEPSAVSVPPTIHAVLAARLERLEPAERGVLEAAAVIGRSFPGAAVLELTGGEDRDELDGLLGSLARKDFVEPDDGRFAGEETHGFKHILARDVAYQGILKERRSVLHERFADWLERTAGERAGEYAEILGYHLERAHSYLTELAPVDEHGRELAGRAATRLGASGRRALARGDIPPAVSLLERAVSLLPEEDPARRELTLKLGIALAETGQLTRVDALLHDRIAAERRGRTLLVFHDETGSQRVVNLDDEAATISVGRLPDSDVALAWDSEVSRRHAQLRRGPDGWMLADEGSRNGTFVNGERIGDPRQLRDGDVLRFGDTVVLFRAPAGDAEPRQPVTLEPGQATSLGKRPPNLEAR